MLESYLELLKQSLSFKSISTDPDHKPDCEACADWYIKLFEEQWFTTKKITWYGNPMVYASYAVPLSGGEGVGGEDKAKTYLVYGHYDVQPASQKDGRKSDPFVLCASPLLANPDWNQIIGGRDERVGEGSGVRYWNYWDGKLYGRGVVDNKGQHLIHIATIFELIKQWKLAYNIKFLLEGDEETGSPYLENFISDYKELLKADSAIISDGEIIWNHTPTMTASFRGGANLSITLKSATTDLHSGIYGNIAPSASHEAAILISKLYDEQWLISIPDRYADLDAISELHMINNAKVPFDEDELKLISWIRKVIAPSWYDPVTANGLLPTIQVSGISSGYTGNGYKNIIPWSATIKINFRFGPGQEASSKIEHFMQWVQWMLPDYIEHDIEYSDPYNAISINIENEDTKKASNLLSEIFGAETIMRYCGAAVPISWMFQDILWCDVIIADLANEDCNMHGVDENFDLSCIDKGLKFSEQFFSN